MEMKKAKKAAGRNGEGRENKENERKGGRKETVKVKGITEGRRGGLFSFTDRCGGRLDLECEIKKGN